MITALDHIVLLCPDIKAATADYTLMFGAEPVWRASSGGVATALFSVGNTALELMAPDGVSETADKLRAMTADGAKLTSLAYRTDDIANAHHLLTRRGLSPSDVSDGESSDVKTGEKRRWRRLRIPDNKMAGIKSFVLELMDGELPKPQQEEGAVTRLDHIVINTPNPERAVATYGARLGLRFALDRTAEQWKTRFLFFKIGDLTFEVIHRLGEAHDPQDNDTIWGMTWEVDNLTASRERLIAAGRDVSEIRKGRKPGTTVFTIRDGTQDVPTLFIETTPR